MTPVPGNARLARSRNGHLNYDADSPTDEDRTSSSPNLADIASSRHLQSPQKPPESLSPGAARRPYPGAEWGTVACPHRQVTGSERATTNYKDRTALSFGISHSTRTSLPRDRRPRRHRPTAREHPATSRRILFHSRNRFATLPHRHQKDRAWALTWLLPPCCYAAACSLSHRDARSEVAARRPRYTPRPPHTSLRKKMTGLRLHSASTAANSPGAES